MSVVRRSQNKSYLRQNGSIAVNPYYLSLNVFIASKGSNLYILFAIPAAGVVPCGGLKKSPRASSIVQIIFFRSFEISKNVQNTHV